MKIRVANREDLPELVAIYNQAIAAGQKTADITPVTIEDRTQWFEEHTPNKYPILVAEEEGSVIGYLTISAYRSGRLSLRYTAEVSYYVHFEHHRKGVGSKLLEHAITQCPALQIKSLFSIILDSNLASVLLMKKFGFEEWVRMPRIAEFPGVEPGHLYYGLRIEDSPS